VERISQKRAQAKWHQFRYRKRLDRPGGEVINIRQYIPTLAILLITGIVAQVEAQELPSSANASADQIISVLQNIGREVMDIPPVFLYLFYFVAGLVVLFLACRAFVLWYWKVNRIVELLARIDNHLEKRIAQTDGA